MANAIDVSLRRIYHEIPKEILEYAFRKDPTNKSLDECIIEQVIKATVIPDLNAVGGKFKEIVLSPEWVIETSTPSNYTGMIGMPLIPYAVYKIPPEAREYRNLTQVICMRSPYASVSSIGQVSSMLGQGMGATAGGLACTVLNQYTGNNQAVLPTPILTHGNCVKLTPMEMSLMTVFPWILECRIEYDVDFTNLNPDSVIPLVRIIVSATKAYIYNKTVIEMDMGVVMAGHPIGMFRDVISEYKNEVERYDVLRDEFHSTATYLDVDTMREIFLLGL